MFELWHLPIVFLAGLIGEGYATIVGSGGVLIQFVLAALGLPLAVVVATDIGGSQGADVGILVASKKNIWKNRKVLLLLGTPLLVGGIIGTLFLIHIPVLLLKIVLIVGLSLLLLYMVMGKKVELAAFENLEINLKQYPVVFLVLFVLGIYGNVSGVGSGTFLKFAFLSLLKISFIESLGIASIVALPAGIFSIIATSISGLIAWPYFFAILTGSFIGANFIAKHARKIPEDYLRIFLIAIVSLYLIYLFWSIVA